MQETLRRDTRVGIFVLLSAFLGGLALFLLGGSSQFLEDRYRLHSKFKDVAGLRQGAMVRLAGIDVGEVSSIDFSADPGVPEIFVELSILEAYAERIRGDSRARIETEGLLGDKYIGIAVGSPEAARLDDGDWIDVEDTISLLEQQVKATEVLANMGAIATKVNMILGDETEAGDASLSNVVMSIEHLLEEWETGDGILHTLIYDEGLSRRVREVAENVERASDDIVAMTTEMREGDGLVHQLVYGEEGTRLAGELADLAEAIDGLVTDVQNEDSLVHALIYEPERAQMMTELHATAEGLRALVEGIQQGDGTAGMLAQDPALYHDLRALVGGAQRNKLLKAYIRRTIEKSEATDAATWELSEDK